MKIKTRPNLPEKLVFSAEIQALIEEAYGLFSFPIGDDLNVCKPCCISLERERELVQTPVANLSLSAIYDYLDAVHYDESGYEIKHFLPRILELLAKGENIRHSTEIMLDKCHFEKSCWREQELDFMWRFSGEFLKNVLASSPKIDNAMNYILMFDLAGLETEHLLKIWQETATESSLWHFVYFIHYEIDEEGIYNNPFSQNPNFNQHITDWISSTNVKTIFLPQIEKLYFENTNLTDKERYMLDDVYGRIEKL
ncbi:MAG: hypothetical protein Q4C98_03795 [Capnocytophaga sp.]|nr:hypothetical protein [Capnocytophaga sp.]